MEKAYVMDENSIKIPYEIYEKLKLKKGMELKIISDVEEGFLFLKIITIKNKDFCDIKGIGKELWTDMDAQEYVNQERSDLVESTKRERGCFKPATRDKNDSFSSSLYIFYI